MGGALGLRAARCEPFSRGLSGAAREQPAPVGVGSAGTVGGVLRGPRGTRTANGRGVRPPGSGTRLEPSSADRPHLGWLHVVVAVWLLCLPRRTRFPAYIRYADYTGSRGTAPRLGRVMSGRAVSMVRSRLKEESSGTGPPTPGVSGVRVKVPLSAITHGSVPPIDGLTVLQANV